MELVAAGSIWLDGELVPWGEAKIHVLSHVVHYGSGVFEGLRVYATPRGPCVLGLDAHVRRLFQSCKIVELPLERTPDEVRAAILDTVRASGHAACYVRPLVFRGYGKLGVDPTGVPVQLAIAAYPLGSLHGREALEKGLRVGVSSWRRMAPDTHPAMAKAVGNYLNSQLVLMEAKRNGYQEGIVLDVDGYVAEGSGQNLFLVEDGRVSTPAVGDSILAGVTRAFVLQLARERGLEVLEQRITRERLYIADELFFTGTAAEITPIASVDGRPVGSGGRGPLTESLQSEFFDLLEGRRPDRHGWLTPVDGER